MKLMENSTILPGQALNGTDGVGHKSFSINTSFIISIFLLIVATVFSNSLVFLAIYAFRGLRTVTNCFVMSLAAADLVVALLAMPVWLISGLLDLDKMEMSLFQLSTRWIEVFCSSISIYGATLVSIDRYLAIIKPLRYREMVTRRRANKAIASVWTLSIVIAAISFIQYQNRTGVYICAIFIFVTILCIPLCVMVFSYICIYRAAMEQLSKMKYSERNFISSSNKQRNVVSERRRQFCKELCITKTLAITVSLFVIAWAPFLVLIMVETFLDPTIKIPPVLNGLILFLPYINSFVNPWVYAGINKDFRKALKKLVCAPQQFCFCVQQNSSTTRPRTVSSSTATGRTLVGSFQGEDQTGSFRTSHLRSTTIQGSTRQADLQCTGTSL